MTILSKEEQWDRSKIKTHILEYLGNAPAWLRTNDNPERALAELTLTVGKLLVWMHGSLDMVPALSPRPSDEPQSIEELGKRFNEVGLELFKPRRADENSLIIIRYCRDMQERLNRLALDMAGLKGKKGGST